MRVRLRELVFRGYDLRDQFPKIQSGSEIYGERGRYQYTILIQQRTKDIDVVTHLFHGLVQCQFDLPQARIIYVDSGEWPTFKAWEFLHLLHVCDGRCTLRREVVDGQRLL